MLTNVMHPCFLTGRYGAPSKDGIIKHINNNITIIFVITVMI